MSFIKALNSGFALKGYLKPHTMDSFFILSLVAGGLVVVQVGSVWDQRQ